MSTLEALLKLRSPKYFSSLRKNASNFVAQKEEDMLEDKDTSEQ